jgi:hypothetical protein
LGEQHLNRLPPAMIFSSKTIKPQNVSVCVGRYGRQ